MIETLTNIAVGVIAVAAVGVVILSFREFRFLGTLRPFLPSGFWPLYEALLGRSIYVTGVGVWLLVLTAIGAVLNALELPTLAQTFPPLRAINALLLLGLLAGPLWLGRAMRRKPPQ